jgi:iron complex transport system substrate-binding protein
LPVNRPCRASCHFSRGDRQPGCTGCHPAGIVESWTEKPVYRYLRPQLSGVPQLGLETQPALEKIVLLNPDIIFASRFRHQDIAPLLQKIAPVALLDDVFEFRKTLRSWRKSGDEERRGTTA